MATGKRLTGPEKVRQLQTVLHAKAKEEPGRRFHALIDKVWREDFLAEAYRRVRRNRGSAGANGEIAMTMCRYPTDDPHPSTLMAPQSMLRPAQANTGVKALERTRNRVQNRGSSDPSGNERPSVVKS